MKGGTAHTIYEQMKAEHRSIEDQLRKISARIETLPEGRLICSRNGSHYKWYQSNGKTWVYIPKSNHLLAEKLAEKKYLTCLFQDLSQEKKAIEYYLKNHRKVKNLAAQLLEEEPECQRLISVHCTPIEKELAEWQSASYEKNPNHPENLKIQSISGNWVRSKSEALIDMILYVNKIPFRYECGLQLGSRLMYPDFTIRHPKTGEFYYWEHFGLMDVAEYRQKVSFKFSLYMEHGIYPNRQLITTYESTDEPFGANQIEKILNQYFD